MRYYLIAGEASGDLHGSRLIRQLRRLDPAAEIRCWGGDLMESAGAVLVKHYRDLAFMGFAEVVRHLPEILGNLSFCKRDIAQFAPDAVILVDYPGFNLRIAQWAHARKFKVVYYISPQVWAWKESRVRRIRRCVDLMLVILPFEEPFYQKWNYPVTYVGHPLLEVVRQAQSQGPGTPISFRKIIALLPGSRKQEVLKKLPVMLAASARFADYDFVVAQAPHMEDALMDSLLANYPNVRVVKGRTYDLLQQAWAALVTSGTATLETALFGVPEVVCYKGSPVSYLLAKRLIKVKYISLVNLIMDEEVVKELIQEELQVGNLERELSRILEGPGREKMLEDYKRLWEKLSAGDASAVAARKILDFLSVTDTSQDGPSE